MPEPCFSSSTRRSGPLRSLLHQKYAPCLVLGLSKLASEESAAFPSWRTPKQPLQDPGYLDRSQLEKACLLPGAPSLLCHAFSLPSVSAPEPTYQQEHRFLSRKQRSQGQTCPEILGSLHAAKSAAICGDTRGRPGASGDPSRPNYNRLGNSLLVHVDSLQESGDSLFVTTRPVSGLSSSRGSFARAFFWDQRKRKRTLARRRAMKEREDRRKLKWNVCKPKPEEERPPNRYDFCIFPFFS